MSVNNACRMVPADRMSWAVSTNKEIALALGYIGILYTTPTRLSRAVRKALNVNDLQPVFGFYYGVPDDSLIDRFGLSKEEVQKQVSKYRHPAQGPRTETRYLKVKSREHKNGV